MALLEDNGQTCGLANPMRTPHRESHGPLCQPVLGLSGGSCEKSAVAERWATSATARGNLCGSISPWEIMSREDSIGLN